MPGGPGVCWWRGVSCTASTAASLGDGRVLMGSRCAVALSDVMVTSSAGWAKFMQISTLKISRWSDGGDGFLYTRCLLRVCLYGCALSFRLEGVSGYAIIPGS